MSKKEMQDTLPTRDQVLEERLKELDAKISLYESKLKELELKTAKAPEIRTEKQERNRSDRKKLEREIAQAYEIVKGRFKFYEVPGGSMSFVFKKYPGKPVEKYTMLDGETYEIPLCVAEHLNSAGRYPVHEYAQDENGVRMRVGKKVARYGFESLDFVRINNPAKEITTVEYL